MSTQYIIPDLLVTWPWKRMVNPRLADVKVEASAWVKDLALFDSAQLQKFNACDFNLLGALVGPLQNKDHLRITCDLMNFYFAFDEYTDLANKSEATKISNDVMEAFRRREANSQPSHGKITAMAQQFFERTVSVVGEDPPAMERFIADFDAYTKSIIVEAEDRVAGHLRTVEDYLILRRDTCGGKPTFSFFGLGLNIPDEVFQHPLMISLIENATDLIAITNDMHSYRLERARGLDGHNIITAIMEEYHLDLQQALYWLSGYGSKTISNFLSNSRALPSWGEKIDRAVMVYIDRVARCVRGYDAWSYETNRYYGEDGLKVQQCRMITLLPPDSGYITREQLEIEVVVA
ncbi:terpenoid synthase [Phlegmacium glaucopus]|nr:terpenoid synthase [Phlegmacium glaucopus]